jgi:colanic acid biosynthesis protein WcaH
MTTGASGRSIDLRPGPALPVRNPVAAAVGEKAGHGTAEGGVGGWLPAASFGEVVRHAPLITIDLVIRSADGRVLLGFRRNDPARNTWFVPGGRIRKDESVVAAFCRICAEELALDVRPSLSRDKAPIFRGVFEHRYQANSLGLEGVSTHCVAMAFEWTEQNLLNPEPGRQHERFAWFTVEELLAHPEVHSDTKAYFENQAMP